MATKNFAQIETSFILRDPRIMSLSPTEKLTYIMLWCYAVDQRRETIVFGDSETFSGRSADVPLMFIGRSIDIPVRYLRRSLDVLQTLKLIEWDGVNTITVCGVKDKHKKLTDWKGTDEGERREEKSREEKSDTHSNLKYGGHW